eukprot:TRINITY_DN6613_c0_g1_i1.p1 TRINITY_DN6613_c0_g1~~TRINITY_DN6613_c0_g1_i1.p1  ORF type:complete len:743 (-),score=195.16 TRINITY_DN6613_c0_g1_i1:30-2027(-)
MELQPLLSVDYSVIEPKINHLVTVYRNYHIVQGEILTTEFLDSVAKEINSLLQETGKVTTSDLCLRFKLPTQFLNEKVLARYLGTTIVGVLEEGTLYTEDFVVQYKYQIRGVFAAILEPVGISAIQQKYNFIPKLFQRVVQALVRDGELAGELLGSQFSDYVYIPSSYEEARLSYINQFLASNNSITYEMLSKLRIPKASEYFPKVGIEGLALNTCFVLKSIVEDIDLVVKEAVADKTWVDVSLSAETLSREDVQKLLSTACPTIQENSKKKESELEVFDDVFVVSVEFIKECLRKFEEHIREDVKKNGPRKITTNSAPEPELDESQGKGRKGKGKRQQKQQQKQVKAKAKEVEKEEVDVEEIVKRLSTWFGSKKLSASKHKNSEENPSEEEFFQLLAEYIAPTLEGIRTKEEANLKQNSASQQRELLKAFQQKFDALYLHFQLFSEALEEVDDESIKSSLSNHLLSTFGEQLLNHICLGQAQNEQVDVTEVDSKNRKSVVEGLPKSIQTLLSTLETSVNTKKLDNFKVGLETVCDKCDIHRRDLDKKSSKTLLQTYRASALEALTSGTELTVGAIFHYILSAINIKLLQSVVLVNSSDDKHLQYLLSALKGEVSDYVYEKLEACFNSIKDNLNAPEGDLEEAKELLPECKKFAVESLNLKKFSP